MKKESLGIAVGTSLALLSVIGTLASNITDATFFGTIQITNNGATAYNQTVNLTLNTTNLINSGLVNASLNNTSIKNDGGADAPYMPGLTPNPWIIFVNAITGPATNLNYTLYTGGNHTMNSSLMWFPDASGMNVTDNASLEPGSNFTWNITGSILGTGDLIKKGSATLNSSPNSVSFSAYGGAASINLTPDGANLSGANLFGAPTNWQAVLTNDGDTTYVFGPSGVGGQDLYSMSNATILGNITSIAIHVVEKQVGGVNVGWRADIITHNVTYSGNTNPLGDPGYNDALIATFNVNPNTTAPWTWQEINDLVAGVSISSPASEGRMTQYYIVVNYTPYLTMTASNLTNPSNIAVTFNGGNCTLYVDNVSKNSTITQKSFSIIDLADDYVIDDNFAFAYVSNVTISLSGTQKGRWQWQYASTFTDLTGNGHTGFPTFRTAGSTSNITANMTSFQPVTQSVSTPNGAALIAQNITSSFTAPPNMFTELVISAPGASFINSILDGVGIPRALFWFPFLFGITNLLGLLAAWLTKSILIECAFMGILLVLLSLMGGFGFWVCIEYIIGASAIVVFSKQFGL